MRAHGLTPTAYVVVCAALVVLTVGTVAISFAPMPGVWHIVLGLLIAVCKASLVVLFFMHVLLSDRVTKIVVLVACFSVGLLFVLTLTDYFTRGMVPYLPGH
jgi:cytochrome c oxidase subunit 4